ncbi:UPF0058 family protein [Methanothermobacter thermautotrophicus]|uniref:UPF0058 family protein n=1 Tax=Methanothermobacter thermautotrophicus TaxID=145262 RepID=UPI003D7FB51E
MYKDEMIQLHQFLVYVLKYLKNGYDIKDECEEYFSLNISPHHIHRTKAEHKYAIFVLSSAISEILARKEGNNLPPNVVNGLSELARRSRKEVVKMEARLEAK